MSGTSQATAFVSGLAALLLSKNPNLTPAELKALIVSNCDKLDALKGKVVCEGKVNAYRTLLAAQDKSSPERDPVRPSIGKKRIANGPLTLIKELMAIPASSSKN